MNLTSKYLGIFQTFGHASNNFSLYTVVSVTVQELSGMFNGNCIFPTLNTLTQLTNCPKRRAQMKFEQHTVHVFFFSL